eukprot:361852-Rhodomonas_salina.2
MRVSSRISLRACDALCGTDIAYDAPSIRSVITKTETRGALLSAYARALSGTDTAYLPKLSLRDVRCSHTARCALAAGCAVLRRPSLYQDPTRGPSLCTSCIPRLVPFCLSPLR